VVRYPVHTAVVGLAFAGILLSCVYDDLIYPVDNGLVSIGFVLVFALALGTLIARAKKAEDAAKAARKAAAGPVPPHGESRPEARP
jgi:hypothetical protein